MLSKHIAVKTRYKNDYIMTNLCRKILYMKSYVLWYKYFVHMDFTECRLIYTPIKIETFTVFSCIDSGSK